MAEACISSATLTDTVGYLAPHAGAELDMVVGITCRMLHADIWGDLLSDAHFTLAAHFATLVLAPEQAGGQVVSRSLDKLSESYAAGEFADAELGSTKYGRLHQMLLGSLRQDKAHSVGAEPVDWSLPDGRVH